MSGCVHGCVLTWVVLGGGGTAEPKAQSIYDQEIRGHEKRIVWYSLREKLPEIAPADTQAGRAAGTCAAESSADDGVGGAGRCEGRYLDLGAGAGSGGAQSDAAAERGGGGAAESGAAVRGAGGEAGGGEGGDVGGGSGGEATRAYSRSGDWGPVVPLRAGRGFVAPGEKRAAAKVTMLAEAPEVKEKHSLMVADLGAPVVPRGPVRGFVAPAEKRAAASVTTLADAPEVKEHRSLTIAARIGALDMAAAPAVADAPAVGVRGWQRRRWPLWG